ncbi:non-specific serine/threonine protein kinase [Trifolium repens]|nr:non-specific serine/threonine protein kinase [Trifolium repens]
MPNLHKFKFLATQCAIAGSPTRSPTTSPVIHLRRRKTLRMFLTRPHDRRRFHPPPLDPPKKSSSDEVKVRHKLKDLFISSPSPPPTLQDEKNSCQQQNQNQQYDQKDGILSGSSVGVRFRTGSPFRRSSTVAALRPVSSAFRYRLLRRAWRPELFKSATSCYLAPMHSFPTNSTTATPTIHPKNSSTHTLCYFDFKLMGRQMLLTTNVVAVSEDVALVEVGRYNGRDGEVQVLKDQRREGENREMLRWQKMEGDLSESFELMKYVSLYVAKLKSLPQQWRRAYRKKEPGERRSGSEELAIEKGKLPTQVQVPSSNLAVGGISSAIDEAVIGLAWLGWSHRNSGNITNNLKYPFWGENREKYCGGSADSNTELTCEGSVPKITINSVKYRILGWKEPTQKLTVARDDYWNDICASSDNHKNSTFDNTLFQRDVGSSASANLNLLYNCNTNLPNMFFSTTCGTTEVVYTLADPALITCTPTLIVEFPTSVAQASQLANLNNINQALENGFDLKWTGNYTVCQRCVDSGGACGNDGGNFRCFCENGAHTTSCDSPMASSSSKSSYSGIIIGTISGIAAIVFITIVVFRISCHLKMGTRRQQMSHFRQQQQSRPIQLNMKEGRTELVDDNVEIFMRNWIYKDLEQGNTLSNCLTISEEENDMVRKITLVKGSNTGIIISEVAGVAVLVCILGAYFVVRRRKKNDDKSRSIDLFMTPCLYVLV